MRNLMKLRSVAGKTIAIFLTLSMTACGGGRMGSVLPFAPPHDPQSSSSSGAFATGTQAGTVLLPAGTQIKMSSLTVLNSIDSTNVSPSGAFSLTAFLAGPQFTLVQNANGNPIMMGWLSPKEPTISARTTAEVLVYFATDSFTLPPDLRQKAMDLIPNLPGLSNVEAAISAALVANPNAFSCVSPAVASALASLVQSLKSTNVSGQRVARHPYGVVVNPAQELSGILTNIDFPDGIHFTNRYRRTSHAFIERVSYTLPGGTVVKSPASLPGSPVTIPSVAGLNGGFVGTFIDIFNGNFAGAEISTPSIPLAVFPGSTSTRYKITDVGPGKNAGDLAQLDSVELSEQQFVVQDYFMRELFLPLLFQILLPAAQGTIDDVFNEQGATSAIGDFIKAIGTQAPQVWTMAESGDMGGALWAAYNALVSSSTLQDFFFNKTLFTIFSTSPKTFKQLNQNKRAVTALKNAKTLLAAMRTVDLALLAFDVTWVGGSLLKSDMADIWTVDVTPDKVVLTPPSASVVNVGIVSFKATVPDASGSGAVFEYDWTNTAQFGHTSDGLSNHKDNFSSTSSTISYLANPSGTGTDTIGVQVLLIDGHNRIPIGKATATVTVTAVAGSVFYQIKHWARTDATGATFILDELLTGSGNTLNFTYTDTTIAPDGRIYAEDIVTWDPIARTDIFGISYSPDNAPGQSGTFSLKRPYNVTDTIVYFNYDPCFGSHCIVVNQGGVATVIFKTVGDKLNFEPQFAGWWRNGQP